MLTPAGDAVRLTRAGTGGTTRMGSAMRPADETGGDSYDLIALRHASGAEKVVLTDGEAERALLLLADATATASARPYR